jgi:hypothetical protein
MDSEGHAEPLESVLLSTEYDSEGRHRRTGIEIWPESEDDDEPTRVIRAAGRLICGTALSVGGEQLATGFFAFSMDGKPGLGRYDILRPTGA